MRLQPIGQEKASEYSSVANKAADRVVGSRIKAKLDKCKISPQQGNEEVFYIRYGEGIDDLRSIIEIGIAHNLIQKSGSWLEWIDPEGESHRYQGMEKFRGFFAKDAKLQRILQKQVLPYLGSSGSSGGEPEDEEDVFGAASFQNDTELKEILSSISSEPDADPD
jgi:recombination protein RecA